MTPTKREVEILQQLAYGEQAQGIGRILGISPNTVRTHIYNLMHKMGVRTRTEAVAVALRARWIA